MYKPALALLVGLALSITLQSASALSLSCKRTSGMHDGFANMSTFESWFPKRVNPTADKQIPSSKDSQVSFQINGARYILTPSKVMTGALPERAGYKSVTELGYKCNASSKEVKLAFGESYKSSGFGKNRHGVSVATNSRSSSPYANFSDKFICSGATYQSSGGPVWHSNFNKNFVNEAKRRGLSCDVGEFVSTQVASTNASDLPDCPSNRDAYWHNCFGIYAYPSGSKYAGDWKDNKKHGQGTYTWVDGDKYVGEYKDDKRDGQGVYIYGPKSEWAGDKYVGEFKDGKRYGQGTYTWANGEKDVGEFKNGVLDGFATRYFADGTIDKEGIWKNDEFQYAEKATPSDSVKIATTLTKPSVFSKEMIMNAKNVSKRSRN